MGDAGHAEAEELFVFFRKERIKKQIFMSYLLYIDNARSIPHPCKKQPSKCLPEKFKDFEASGPLCRGSQLALAHIPSHIKDRLTITNISMDLTPQQRQQLVDSGVDGSPSLVDVQTGEIRFGTRAIAFLKELSQTSVPSFSSAEDDAPSGISISELSKPIDTKVYKKEKPAKIDMNAVKARLKEMEKANEKANQVVGGAE